LGYLSVISNADQLSDGKLLDTGIPQVDKAIGYSKVILDLISLKKGVTTLKNIDNISPGSNSSSAMPIIITGSAGTLGDVQESATKKK